MKLLFPSGAKVGRPELVAAERFNADCAAQTTHAFRHDIQALRGYAVFLVILYHANPAWLPAGYLGVDIFFVISGYVITRLLMAKFDSNSFSLTGFYLWRAKRLLPAAYVTFLAVALLSPLFLSAAQLGELKKQLLGALMFAGNVALWMQTGYFEGAAESKPLLHVWSLALEEQFYFLLPAALLVTPRHLWRSAITLLVVMSLALCAYGVRSHPAAAFYLLPTRAWELGIGAVAALTALNRRDAVLPSLLPLAICILLVAPVVPFGSVHPGVGALSVCLATAGVLLVQSPRAASPLVRPLSHLGDISYSLYLVHWPIICFLYIAWLDEVPPPVKVGAILLSLAAGSLLCFTVERPLRRAVVGGKTIIVGLIFASSIVAASAVALHATSSDRDIAFVKRPNHGLSPACDFPGDFQIRPECQTGLHPTMLVWGDSFAMHLVPGLAASNASLVQGTKSVCGPFLAVAPFESVIREGFTVEWARGCRQFNDSIIEFLRTAHDIEVVALSSSFWAYLGSPSYRVLKHGSEGDVATEGSMELALWSLGQTVRTLRSLGKRVVIVAPPPSSGLDLSACAERLASGRFSLGYGAQCEHPRRLYEARKSNVIGFLKAAEAQLEVPVIWFDDVLCSASGCATFVENTFVYRDAGHLSHEGSVFVARKMNLLSALTSSAR